MQKYKLGETLEELLKLYHPHFIWQESYTYGLSHLIDHLLNKFSTESQPISAQTMSGLGFGGDLYDPRAYNLYRADLEGYEIYLGWSWLDYEAQRKPKVQRPRWPASLGIQTENLVFMTGIAADADRESTTSNSNNGPWAFRRSLIECQLQEVDWWLLQHARATAACQTRLLLSALESNGGDQLRRMTIDLSEVDNDQGFRHRVRGVLVLRAVLVGCLLASAMDLSSLYERHITEELVLLK